MSTVVGLHIGRRHDFSKRSVERVDLIAGVGVAGDAHSGPLVQHRSRVAADPQQPNLRQVHLIASELFAVLDSVGHHVEPGELGENITTAGLDLHELPVGTMLRLGDRALVAITGRRNPCAQIDAFQPGLLKHLARRRDGAVVGRAGIMGVVVLGGTVHLGDPIETRLPPGPPRQLERV